jgi:hypothetical protein
LSAYESARSRPSEWVAGYLAAIAIFISLIGIAWHPLRLIIPSMVLALLASAMGGRHQRLAFVAVLVAGVSFFLGMMFAVLTENPLW